MDPAQPFDPHSPSSSPSQNRQIPQQEGQQSYSGSYAYTASSGTLGVNYNDTNAPYLNLNRHVASSNGDPLSENPNSRLAPHFSQFSGRSPLYSPIDSSGIDYFGADSQGRPRDPTIDEIQGPLCEYGSSSVLYAMDWSMDDHVCLGSYKEDNRNKLQVIYSDDLRSWNEVASASVLYPVSNIQWLPKALQPGKLATSSDSLRIWSFNPDVGGLTEQINLSLCKYAKQNNINLSDYNSRGTSAVDKLLGELPPVTSFHWNPVDPNLLVSCSIDTTCTIWDLNSSDYVKTQLIAHDSEVYDVKFLAKMTNLFASCGGDGSVRIFDLRSLAHSTIIYEPPATSAASDPTIHNDSLLRLEPSPFDPNVLATFVCNSNSIMVLDMRKPVSPVLTLSGHRAAVNQIKWHPTRRNVLLSCSDDCQIMYWDLSRELITSGGNSSHNNNGSDSNHNSSSSRHSQGGSSTKNNNTVLQIPEMVHSNSSEEVNNISWRPNKGDWFGLVSGKKFSNVKVSIQ